VASLSFSLGCIRFQRAVVQSSPRDPASESVQHPPAARRNPRRVFRESIEQHDRHDLSPLPWHLASSVIARQLRRFHVTARRSRRRQAAKREDDVRKRAARASVAASEAETTVRSGGRFVRRLLSGLRNALVLQIPRTRAISPGSATYRSATFRERHSSEQIAIEPSEWHYDVPLMRREQSRDEGTFRGRAEGITSRTRPRTRICAYLVAARACRLTCRDTTGNVNGVNSRQADSFPRALAARKQFVGATRMRTINYPSCRTVFTDASANC